ncbi:MULTISPECIES: hypothetical protein [Actinomadura]|uniref:DUF3060 domain-containing protein n=1 Tax=Actinomadura yumaensis TaxID=111807 RepID=A0ABW2CUL7_9ACTN|nr:hypothetical protein [Actinomadura sp. J1-007]
MLAPVLVLPLAGCGDDEPSSGAGHSSAASTPPPSAPSSASAPPSKSATPAPVKAKDGKRLAACSDARCEVQVKAGETIRFTGRAARKAGFEDLKVKSVRPDKLVYTMASGAATFTQPGPPDSVNVNGISLTFVRAEAGRATIRIGKPVPGATQLRVGGGGMSVTTPGG